MTDPLWQPSAERIEAANLTAFMGQVEHDWGASCQGYGELYDFSIAEMEKHLARNGTVIVKFWLNVSQDEQRDRFLARIEDPSKNWKFSSHDLAERALWGKYMSAYQDALRETSRAWAPWYAIPADDKPSMRLAVAEIVRNTLRQLPLAYPKLAKKDKARLNEAKEQLEDE